MKIHLLILLIGFLLFSSFFFGNFLLIISCLYFIIKLTVCQYIISQDLNIILLYEVKAMSQSTRIHETHIMQDDLLPFIFRTDRPDLKPVIPNWHENIELLCFTEGSGIIQCGENDYSVSSGDIAVINPNVLHRTQGRLVYHCLIVDRSFCEQNGIPVLSLFFRELIRDSHLFELFLRIADEIYTAKSDRRELSSVPTVRSLVLSLLSELCRSHIVPNHSEKRSTASSERVKAIMIYMRTHFAEKITLDAIAEHIGVSKYHLSREFRRLTGTTIFYSLNAIRCREARHMLAGGATVSEASSACGFENLSYFSRTFKKYTGKLPSAYIKKLS